LENNEIRGNQLNEVEVKSQNNILSKKRNIFGIHKCIYK
jgi:hypothetical protein